MAISNFGRGKGDDTSSPTSPMSTSSSSAGSGGATNLTAFIDQGSEFEGKLTFKDTVRIDGSFQGEISSENTLIVGETGHIDAAIRSNNVVVSGTVVGNIDAARQVILHKSARVDGDIVSPSLVIEEGATFNGRVSMKGGGKGSGKLESIKGGSPGGPDAPKQG